MGHVTITLKLHRPGRRKQAVLQDAATRYNEAFCWLLARAEARIDEFHALAGHGAQKRSARLLRTWVDKDMNRELNRFGVEPFKDALKNDFSGLMAGYLARWERNPYARLVPPKQRAVLFCRYDTKRDWCLVYNPETDRFYAKLYLVNRDGSLANRNTEQARLVHVHRDRTPLSDTNRMIRYLLFPLAFGKRQEVILKEVIQNPERFRCARLIQRDAEWFLVCSLETEAVPVLPTPNRIGFARAMHSGFSWTVSGADERILANGLEPLPPHAIRPDGTWTGNGLHAIANRMVALSLVHMAEPVVAPLVRKGDHLHWVDSHGAMHGPMIDGHAWNKILALLRYKLPMKGLPAPVSVSPNNMFRTCPTCGKASLRNRMDRNHFLCVSCGHAQLLDTLGSRNLALRIAEYERLRQKASEAKQAGDTPIPFAAQLRRNAGALRKITLPNRPSRNVHLIPSRLSR